MLELEESQIVQKVQITKKSKLTQFVKKTKPFVIVGLPAYNEEKTIGPIIIAVQKYADIVLVCDDGSTDKTAKIAEELGAYVIKHKKNFGYGSAVASLFQHARRLGADILVTLDADGQHNASEIPKIIRPLIEKKADIVIGSRFLKSKKAAEMPIYRQIGAKIITSLFNRISNFASKSAKYNVSDSQSGYRSYNRRAIEQLNVLDMGMGASVQILLEASKENLIIQEVSSTCKYEIEGDTSSENPFFHGISVLFSIIRFIL